MGQAQSQVPGQILSQILGQVLSQILGQIRSIKAVGAAAVLTLLLVGVACTPTSDTSTSAEETGMEITEIIDERTAVFPAGTDIYQNSGSAPTNLTPSEENVAAALNTIETNPELAWAIEHTKFITGRTSDADGDTVGIDFSCEAAPLTTPEQALEELRRSQSVAGGGSCFGFAVFDLEGTLLRSGQNGSS